METLPTSDWQTHPLSLRGTKQSPLPLAWRLFVSQSDKRDTLSFWGTKESNCHSAPLSLRGTKQSPLPLAWRLFLRYSDKSSSLLFMLPLSFPLHFVILRHEESLHLLSFPYLCHSEARRIFATIDVVTLPSSEWQKRTSDKTMSNKLKKTKKNLHIKKTVLYLQNHINDLLQEKFVLNHKTKAEIGCCRLHSRLVDRKSIQTATFGQVAMCGIK